MPIHHAIWRVGDAPTLLTTTRLASEQQLEDMIVRDPRILSSEWMLIGRQERTSDGGRIDLLAIAPDGSLVLIEVKRDRTPREVVAQALDYAEWVSRLTAERLVQIYERFSQGGSLDAAFQQRFGVPLDEDTLNQSHQIILVAAELDPSTERIVAYLNARDIAINVLFFRVFQHGDEQLLSRAWLIDPGETQVNAAQTIGSNSGEAREPWNGEFYVSFGDPQSRSWDDARRYGFISGGGGSWYSQTLKLLQPDDRIWVKIPGTGYVGVGRVIEPVQPVSTFTVATPEGEKPAMDVLQFGDHYRKNADNPELSEYFVRVKWLDVKDANHAINEVGLFGNQNTVCKPTAPKWRHTVERLKMRLPNWDAQ
jgi:hypothetical protein